MSDICEQGRNIRWSVKIQNIPGEDKREMMIRRSRIRLSSFSPTGPNPIPQKDDFHRRRIGVRGSEEPKGIDIERWRDKRDFRTKSNYYAVRNRLPRACLPQTQSQIKAKLGAREGGRPNVQEIKI